MRKPILIGVSHLSKLCQIKIHKILSIPHVKYIIWLHNKILIFINFWKPIKNIKKFYFYILNLITLNIHQKIAIYFPSNRLTQSSFNISCEITSELEQPENLIEFFIKGQVSRFITFLKASGSVAKAITKDRTNDIM